MSKKLYFLISFVLVLSLSGAAQAWESIDDFNYNLSFEYDACGVQMVCSHRVGCPPNWDPNYVSFVFSASTAFKASFVAETCLCPQGHQNGLFIKLTEKGIFAD